MNINIKTKNIVLNDALKFWVEEKVGELGRVLGKFKKNDEFEGGKDKIEIEVEIGKVTKSRRKGEIFRAELQLYLPKKRLRVVSRNVDLRTAIVEARNELNREIRRYKGKRLARARKWARKAKFRATLPKFLRRG